MSRWKDLLDIPSIAKPVEFQIIECARCGSKAQATCSCGVTYLPANVRAAEAVRANPEKSNRAIAAEIGVSHPTVAKARKETTGNDLPVEKRIGLDGKARKQPAKVATFTTADGRTTTIPASEVSAALMVDDQETLFDQACMILDEMSCATRQRFFAYVKQKYAAVP